VAAESSEFATTCGIAGRKPRTSPRRPWAFAAAATDVLRFDWDIDRRAYIDALVYYDNARDLTPLAEIVQVISGLPSRAHGKAGCVAETWQQSCLSPSFINADNHIPTGHRTVPSTTTNSR
jgi:hypothetical protein